MNEKRSTIGQWFTAFVLGIFIFFGYQFASKYLAQNKVALSPARTPVSYAIPQSQPVQSVYVAPTSPVQATVEAFYAAPAYVAPVEPVYVEPTPIPSIKLTVCANSPMFSTTDTSNEYLVGYVGQGMVLDIAERSSDAQWVRLAQGNESIQFWVPAAAFCFE